MPEDKDSKYENLVSVYDSSDEKSKLERLLQDAESADNNRQSHILNSARWYKKRFGIRPARVTWPWNNAANLHMPLTDKTIRRAKPNFANLMGSNYPTVVFESNLLGDDQNLIRGLERRFHEMIFDEEEMNCFMPLCWGIDLMLERGRFLTKVVQEFRPILKTEEIVLRDLSPEMQQFLASSDTSDEMIALELSLRFGLSLDDKNDVAQIRAAVKQLRSGKDTIRFERIINTTPYPTLVVRDPNTVLFPQDTTFLISKARWIRDRVQLTENDLISRVESGSWQKANGNLLLDRLIDGSTGPNSGRYSQNSLPDNSQVEELQDQREGLSPARQTGAFIFDEYYFWKKMPGKRMLERMVLTIHPDHPDLPLRLIRYPYIMPSGDPEEWPFDQIMSEIISDRAYAPRGYPQLLDSLQTELTNNHNAKSNNMTIANNLNIKAKRNSGVSTQFIPGQPLWVNRMDDVMELTVGAKDMSFDNEERNLVGWAEGYIGLIDQTLTNITGAPERRTKAEIDAVSALQAQVASLDVRIFQSCMQRPYRRIWNRWMQYGPAEIQFMGPDGRPRSVAKEEIKSRFKIKTIGNIFSTNRQLRANRMANLYQSLATEPLVDRFKLLNNWLSLEDERLAMDVLRTPEAAQQEQIDRFIRDIDNINTGYTVVPRPADDNQMALQVIQNYMQDPLKRRNLHPDRVETLVNFYKAHQLALEKKNQSSTRGGRMEQEVAAVAQGESGREARK